MPTSGLPEYAPPSQRLSPAYTALPRTHEHRLDPDRRLRPNRLSCSFVKRTKGGNVSLRLAGQDDRATLPVDGLAAPVQGTVEVDKTEGVTSVEVQVEGILKLEEVAESGTPTHVLFSKRSVLWGQGQDSRRAMSQFVEVQFFASHDLCRWRQDFLPPSFEAHLSGLPGFRANVDYSVGAVVVKPNGVSNLVKFTLFRRDDWTVSTPLLYLPRTRPSVPISAPLVAIVSSSGFTENSQWKSFSACAAANRSGVRDLMGKLYIPSTRIFCVCQPIPFHLSFHCDVDSLLNFLPFAPVAGLIAPKRQVTRIQLMRQVSAGVRNGPVSDTKTDIWRVDCVGEGAFRGAAIGADWAAFSGDIYISDEITVGGFRASGFSVRDYLVLSMTPPDPVKSPFKELRMVVPIRMATDRWNEGGTGLRGAPEVIEQSSNAPGQT